MLLLLLQFSLYLFTLLRLYVEIRDIWRPGARLAGTRDSVAQIRDIPGNPGRVATLMHDNDPRFMDPSIALMIGG